MKLIDDAPQLCGRIVGALRAGRAHPATPYDGPSCSTFTVVCAGSTGVEMAGKIVCTLRLHPQGRVRCIDSTKARVILLNAASAAPPPTREKLGKKAQALREKMGVPI